jgi:hypothetical protein
MDEAGMIMILASLPGPFSGHAKGGLKKRWPVQFALYDSVVWLCKSTPSICATFEMCHSRRGDN